MLNKSKVLPDNDDVLAMIKDKDLRGALKELCKTEGGSRVARVFACDVAERTLPVYEKKFPNDKRPHEAIEAARQYLTGEITIEQLREKRSAAYDADAAAAAAYAADAAYAAYAAYAAAAAAAYAAADAYAAAAEREWQREHLIAMLNGVKPSPEADQSIKQDAGKLEMGACYLHFAHATEAAAEVREFSREAKGRHNFTWEGVEIPRWKESFFRHFTAWCKDETSIDVESGKPNHWHMKVSLDAIIELEQRAKKIAGVLLIALFMAAPAYAGDFGIENRTHGADYLLETTNQNRDRHSAYRYDQQQRYQSNTGGYSGAPLGGYREPLGDSAPTGTSNPGYVHDKGMNVIDYLN